MSSIITDSKIQGTCQRYSSDAQAYTKNTVSQKSAQSLAQSNRIQATIKEAIRIVGNQNLYQGLLVFYICVNYFIATYFWTAPSYLFMNPNFDCKGNSPSEQEACAIIQQCYLKNDYTITARNQIYCGRQNERNAIQAAMGLGGLVACMVINFISDYRGRKFSFLIAIFVGMVSAVLVMIGTYTDSFILMMVSQYGSGFSAFGQIYIYYILTDKLLSTVWNNRAVFFTTFIYGLGQASTVFFTIGLTWFHYILLQLIASSLLFISALILLTEDPVLLFTKKRYIECKESIRKIAKINGTQSKLQQALKIVQELQQQQEPIKSSIQMASTTKSTVNYLNIFKDQNNVLLPTLLLSFCLFGSNMVYFVISFVASDVGISFGINMLVFGVAGSLGCLPLLWISHKIPRIKGFIVIISIQIILGFIFLFQIPLVVQTVLAALLRFLYAPRYALFMLYVTQRFPQQIQSTALGLIGVIGKIATIFAPLEVRISGDMGVHPLVVVASLQIFTGLIPCFFLKETLPPQNEKVQECQRLILQQHKQ